MVRTPKQVQQVLFVVFKGSFQGGPPSLKFSLEVVRHKPLLQHIAIGQLINHARMLNQITGWPFGCAQQAQQPLMDSRALEHHGQVTFAAHQWLHPVCHPDHRILFDPAFLEPLRRALQQPHETAPCIVPKAFDLGAVLPMGQARAGFALKKIQHRL